MALELKFEDARCAPSEKCAMTVIQEPRETGLVLMLVDFNGMFRAPNLEALRYNIRCLDKHTELYDCDCKDFDATTGVKCPIACRAILGISGSRGNGEVPRVSVVFKAGQEEAPLV